MAATIAVVFFAPLFRWGLARPALFWWWMAASLVVLNGTLWMRQPAIRRLLLSDCSAGVLKKAAIGLGSAALLYGIFLAGRWILTGFFPAAEKNILQVYLLRPALPAWLIALLMILIIGPGEEVFWRVFLQQKMVARFGPAQGCLFAAILYAGVHAGSGNPVLVLAALTAGLFWGLLYSLTRSPISIIASHVSWDLAVFLVAPFS
ncbi:MAG: CPBP family intramembrane metalloprotease [Verrucomicrobia bacterium]|nr:CPBP family intramembrane metalloprotease [Verrucomicrobiota bacterium]